MQNIYIHFFIRNKIFMFCISTQYIPCTITSTWDILSHTTRELLILPTPFTPVRYSIFSFFILNKSKTQPLPHLQKTCCQVLPTPLEDAQMPSLSGFSDFCPAYLSSPKRRSRCCKGAVAGSSVYNIFCCSLLIIQS